MAAPGGGSYYNPDRLPPSVKVRRKPVRPTLRRRYNPDVRGSTSAGNRSGAFGYYNPDAMPRLARKVSGPMLGRRAYASLVGIEIDEKAFDAAIKRLERFADKPLKNWAKSVWYQAMKTLDRPLKLAAPRAREKKKPGQLMRSISARPNRLRTGELAAASNGPRGKRAPHRYLVIMGAKPHSLKANTSKYRAKSGKSPWSVFPARGGLRPKKGPSSKRVYREQNLGGPTSFNPDIGRAPVRRAKGQKKLQFGKQLSSVKRSYKPSGKIVAWNADIVHPGHAGNKFLEKTWSSNEQRVIGFIKNEINKHGESVRSFQMGRV